ncbi:MAG: aldehyde dehydrogenase family protein, partial [Brevibacterium linens]
MSNYRVENPATGDIVETFPEATDAEIESTVAGAHTTYLTWKDTDIQERASIVRRAAEIFHERKDELARTISVEMGKSYAESVDEVEFAADIIDYYGVHGP